MGKKGPRATRRRDSIHYSWHWWHDHVLQLQSLPTWDDAVEASYTTFVAGTGVTDNLITPELPWPEQYLSHPAMRDETDGDDRVMAAWDEWLARHPERRLDEGSVSRSERLAAAIATHVPNPRPFSNAHREANPEWYARLYEAFYRPLFERALEHMRQEQMSQQATQQPVTEHNESGE
jgi:hypothetical protein